MTNSADRLLSYSTRARMNKLQPKPEEIPAFLGLIDKTIRVPNRPYWVYCRRTNGDIIKAFNNIMPANRPGLAVTLVHKRHWFVQGPRDTYADPVFLGLADGVTQEMTFPGQSSPFIAWQQYLPGLVQAIGGLTLRIYAYTLDIPDVAGVTGFNTQDIDMTPYLPASGAWWARLEVGAGGINVVTPAASVADVSLLTYADVPAGTDGYKSLAAVKLYAGQTKFFYYTSLPNSDVIDLRADGGSLAAYSNLKVKEIDGTPSVSHVKTIRVSNGTLTNDGAGQVTIETNIALGSELIDLTAQVTGSETHFTFSPGASGIEVLRNGITEKPANVTYVAGATAFDLATAPAAGANLIVRRVNAVTTVTEILTYDSGWFAISTGEKITKTHSLGTQKLNITIYLATDSGGTDGQVYASYTEPGYTYGASVQINNNDNAFDVVMGSSGYAKRNNSGGVVSYPSTGIYCRVVALGFA